MTEFDDGSEIDIDATRFEALAGLGGDALGEVGDVIADGRVGGHPHGVPEDGEIFGGVAVDDERAGPGEEFTHSGHVGFVGGACSMTGIGGGEGFEIVAELVEGELGIPDDEPAVGVIVLTGGELCYNCVWMC